MEVVVVVWLFLQCSFCFGCLPFFCFRNEMRECCAFVWEKSEIN